jgi:IS5 family transposase
MPQVDLAIPAFGYKNHVSIDRCHGLIRKWTATDASKNPSRIGDGLIHFVRLKTECWNGWATWLF